MFAFIATSVSNDGVLDTVSDIASYADGNDGKALLNKTSEVVDARRFYQ